jgi:hypothetical protein
MLTATHVSPDQAFEEFTAVDEGGFVAQDFADLRDRLAGVHLGRAVRGGDLSIGLPVHAGLEDLPPRLVDLSNQCSLEQLQMHAKLERLAHVERRRAVQVRLVRHGVVVAHSRLFATHGVVRALIDPEDGSLGRRLLAGAEPFEHLEQRGLDDRRDPDRIVEVPAGPLLCGLAEQHRRERVTSEEPSVVERHAVHSISTPKSAPVACVRALSHQGRNSRCAAPGQCFSVGMSEGNFRIRSTLGQGSARVAEGLRCAIAEPTAGPSEVARHA